MAMLACMAMSLRCLVFSILCGLVRNIFPTALGHHAVAKARVFPVGLKASVSKELLCTFHPTIFESSVVVVVIVEVLVEVLVELVVELVVVVVVVVLDH